MNSNDDNLANSDRDGRMAWRSQFMINSTKNYYRKIYSFSNLYQAWRDARKGKTKKPYVVKFEKNLERNLLDLQFELKSETYKPLPLKTFILRDPKTRKISKSDFRDRIIHHALVLFIEPIFEKSFIYDSCANRMGKGTLYAVQRFSKFQGEVTNNYSIGAFCLKADIKHYFQEVDHEILLSILKRKISDKKVIWLIKQILANNTNFRVKRERERVTFAPPSAARQRTLDFFQQEKGMPLGNLTSQFFANVYLNYVDHFVKRRLQAKYYIRYVDDFVILHKSKEQLEIWKKEIDSFLRNKLKLELHPDKSRIIPLPRGIDFVGFRNFYHFKLLRKRSIRKMLAKIEKYHRNETSKEKLLESFQGWNAHAKWANTFLLRKSAVKKIYNKLSNAKF